MVYTDVYQADPIMLSHDPIIHSMLFYFSSQYNYTILSRSGMLGMPWSWRSQEIRTSALRGSLLTCLPTASSSRSWSRYAHALCRTHIFVTDGALGLGFRTSAYMQLIFNLAKPYVPEEKWLYPVHSPRDYHRLAFLLLYSNKSEV